ncbi:MAG: copper-binding protein [Betaproteobacteria bacterium]
MKGNSILLAILVLAIALPLGTRAADEHDSKHHAEANSPNNGAPLAPGEVKKVDKEAGKVTIKHGPLENLGMPAMTMVFRVKDPAMLEQLKAGDKINFLAEKWNGALTVMRLEAAK